MLNMQIQKRKSNATIEPAEKIFKSENSEGRKKRNNDQNNSDLFEVISDNRSKNQKNNNAYDNIESSFKNKFQKRHSHSNNSRNFYDKNNIYLPKETTEQGVKTIS